MQPRRAFGIRGTGCWLRAPGPAHEPAWRLDGLLHVVAEIDNPGDQGGRGLRLTLAAHHARSILSQTEQKLQGFGRTPQLVQESSGVISL